MPGTENVSESGRSGSTKFFRRGESLKFDLNNKKADMIAEKMKKDHADKLQLKMTKREY